MTVRDTAMGAYLKIICRGGVYNHLNAESDLWEMMQRDFKGEAVGGGEVRWTGRKSYGAAASQFVATGSVGDFPAGQDSELGEFKAFFKEHSVAIEVPLSVIRLAEKDFGRYGKPVVEEVQAKSIAHARMLSSTLPMSSHGIIGEVSSAAVVGGDCAITLKTGNADPGFVGWFFEGDLLKIGRSSGPTAATINGGTAVTDWQVVSVVRGTNVVTLQPRDSNGDDITVSSISSTDPQAGDYIRRLDTTYFQHDAISSSSEMGTITNQWPGLEDYADVAEVGYKVWDQNLTGAFLPTNMDCGASLIDPQLIRQGLTKVKLRVGRKRYVYDKAFMAPEVEDLFAEEVESSRVINAMRDAVRGNPGMAYQHGKDQCAYETDEFIPLTRIFCPPRGDVLKFDGGDFEYVSPEGGSIWHYKPSSTAGRYQRKQVAFMEGCGLFYIQHPAALLTFHNFARS